MYYNINEYQTRNNYFPGHIELTRATSKEIYLIYLLT